MNNKIIAFIGSVVFFLLTACTDDSSSTNAAENSRVDSQTEVEKKLEPPYGIVPIDTTNMQAFSQTFDPIDGMPISSSSKTEYRFNSEKTPLFVDIYTSFYIMAYYEEKGIQSIFSKTGGSFSQTYRLLQSDEGTTFVGLLWSNAYWGASCAKDSAWFYENCTRLNGEFVDYNNGCQVNRLDLSCVYPFDYTDSVEALNQLGKEAFEYVKDYLELPEDYELPDYKEQSHPCDGMTEEECSQWKLEELHNSSDSSYIIN